MSGRKRIEFWGVEDCVITDDDGGCLVESTDDSNEAIIALLRDYFGATSAKERARQGPVITKFLQWLGKARRTWRAGLAAEHATAKRKANRQRTAAARLH